MVPPPAAPLAHRPTLAYLLGRLLTDTNAAGGALSLSRTASFDRQEVTTSTASGRTTTYTITALPTGDESRTVSDAGCACSESESIKGTDGSTTTSARDGTVSYQQLAGDPRFGMQAPYMGTQRVTTPSALTSTTRGSRSVTLATPGDMFSLATRVDDVTVNGATTETIDAAVLDRECVVEPVSEVCWRRTNLAFSMESLASAEPADRVSHERSLHRIPTTGRRRPVARIRCLTFFSHAG